MTQVLVNNEVRIVSAATGTAIDTTLAVADTLSFPAGTEYLYLEGRNYSTAVTINYMLNPWLTVLLTTDNLDTAPTDVSSGLQNNVSATASLTLNSLGAITAGDYVLVGSHIPFRGVAVDVVNTNSNSETLNVDYWNGTVWGTITETDNTESGGATLAQDGLVTWTVPTDWARASLMTMTLTSGGKTALTRADDGFDKVHQELYWTRWHVSGALDSTVSISQMHALNRSTARIALTSGKPGHEYFIRRGENGIGNIEAVTDAGTANLIVHAGSGRGTFG